MSEKHLTELPWKTLVVKQGVKDLGLGKALCAYAICDGVKEPAKTLEALKEIAELATKLKKANPAKEEVVDHLDEVLKEVKKTSPILETRVKAATAAAAKAEAATKAAAGAKQEEEQDEEEEAEAAELKKDLKRQMASAMQQVKARAPGDPEQQKEPKPQMQFMAYLTAKVSSVVVARKVGSGTKKLLPGIAGGVSGGKFVQGECIFEKNSHTFVLDTVPGGLAKKLAGALFAETGVKYKVRLRSTDGSMELDSDTDVDPDAAPAPAPAAAAPPPPPPPPPPSPAPSPEMLAFTARFKGLQEYLLKAIAAKTPQGEEARKHATDAGVLANKKDFVGAGKLLDRVEALVKKPAAPTAPGAPKTAAATPGPAAATVPKPPGASPSLSSYMNASVKWKAAKKTAADGVFALKKAIINECDPELEDAVKAKIDQLNGILTIMDDGIVTKVQEAGNEQDEERQAERNQALVKFANNMLANLRKHPLANVVDSNPFGTFTIRGPVENVLTGFVNDFGG